MLATPAAIATPYTVESQKDVAVRMRDGTVLLANVYRPGAPGKYPVIVSRTPYGKNDFEEFARTAAAQGYVSVVEDVRGRYGSGGRFYPFVHEIDDGYDTVEWAAQQPYSDGRIVMYGESYLGIAQWLAALAAPPHLVAIAPMLAPSTIREDAIYRGGAFEQLFDQSWSEVLANNTYPNPPAFDFRATRDLPLAAFPSRAHLDTPYYGDWLSRASDDAYWDGWGSLSGHYGRIAVPAFIVGGWYDIFLGGSIDSFEGMRAGAATTFARTMTRLTIAPGGHSGWRQQIGAVDFGPKANVIPPDPSEDINQAILQWFGDVLRGSSTRAAVRYFVMGENDWRDASAWPPPDARPLAFYLHSGGRANGNAKRGALSAGPPNSGERADAYAYDPSDPVPTSGGALCCGIKTTPKGPQDQTQVERRPDVLVYSTPPLHSALLLAGPVRATLYATSDARDTDFTAKLVDVWPNGFAQNLCDGIVRARFRRSMSSPLFLRPGEIERYDVDLGATAAYLAPGHRLRLEVSSSNWPRFDRNLNVGDAPGTSKRMRVAHNAIHHDARHASALRVYVLPVAPSPGT